MGICFQPFSICIRISIKKIWYKKVLDSVLKKIGMLIHREKWGYKACIVCLHRYDYTAEFVYFLPQTCIIENPVDLCSEEDDGWMDDATRPDTNQRALKLSLNLGIPSNSLHSPFFDIINQLLGYFCNIYPFSNLHTEAQFSRGCRYIYSECNRFCFNFSSCTGGKEHTWCLVGVLTAAFFSSSQLQIM